MITFDLHKKLSKHSLNIQGEFNVGDFVLICGKSGIGKTTFLRCLAGLEEPESGLVKVDNQTWVNTSDKLNLAPQERNLGMVFQDFALFPHLTVQENIVYSNPRDKNQPLFNEMIEVFEIGGLLNYKPNQLSGGEQQRVALARSLYQQPEILLLDEPFSSLNTDLVTQLSTYLKKITTLLGITVVMVSHRKNEFSSISDVVYELSHHGLTKVSTLENPPVKVKIIDKRITEEASFFTLEFKKTSVTLPVSHDDYEKFNIGDVIQLTTFLTSAIEE